jgi:CHASE2 domain-containing sensor protein
MHNLKTVFEGITLLSAGVAVLGWFASALPPLAALASIFWIGFQWYHSAPMKQWRARRKGRRCR